MKNEKGLTTTNIGANHKKILQKLAASHNMSQVQFINESIFYFKTTGLSPIVTERFSPKIAIEKLTKRVDTSIGFFQRHEQEKLQPILDNLIVISQRLSKSIEYSVTKSDLAEIQNELATMNKSITEIIAIAHGLNERIFELKDIQKQGFKILSDSMNNSQAKQLRNHQYTHTMLEVFFEAYTTKGIGGVKQDVIDRFYTIKNSQ